MTKKLALAVLFLLGLSATGSITPGQENKAPMTRSEILSTLKKAPELRASQGDLAAEITQRGVAFVVDDRVIEEFQQAGAKSFVLEAIRRAAEVASRPKLQAPAASAPPVAQPVEREFTPEERAAALARLPLLEQARWHALDYVEELPNFTVTQIVSRYEQSPPSREWKLRDTLEIELTYRVKDGEMHKLVKVNGVPAKQTYEALGGSTSTGEFGSLLGAVFHPDSKAEFKELKREVYNGHATVVFDFRVKTVHSQSQITDKDTGRAVVAGYSGSVWIDTESKRVLRIEVAHENMPPGFPVTLAENAVEYDWLTVADERFLLPVRAEVLLGRDRDRFYSRNVIEMRNYHRFDTDVQIVPVKDPQ